MSGVHEWVSAIGEGYGPVKCEHGELPPDWTSKVITSGSPPHKALAEIVLNNSLLKKIPYYVNFRYKFSVVLEGSEKGVGGFGHTFITAC